MVRQINLKKKDDPPQGGGYKPPSIEFAEPQKSLVPVIGNFYTTPSEPADPRDCDRYSSSPFCGGNPFSRELIDIEPSIVVSKCDLGIQLEPTLGFIKLPPVQIVYRSPDCTLPPPPPPSPPPPFEPPDWSKNLPPLLSSLDNYFLLFVNGSSLLPLNLERLDGCDLNLIYGLFKVPADAWKAIYTRSRINPEWGDINYPPAPNEQNSGDSSDAAKYWLYSKGYTRNLYKYGVYLNKKYVGQIKIWTYGSHPMIYGPGPALAAFCSWNFKAVTVQEETFEGSGSTSDYPVESRLNIPIWIGANLIKVIRQKSRFECSDIPIPPPPPEPPPPEPPLPPPPKRCEPCMSCCTPNDEDSELMKLLLKKIEEVNSKVGKFPVKAAIFDSDENKQDAQGKNIDINSIAEAIPHTFEEYRKISKIIGLDAFPIKVPESIIEVADKNLLQMAWDWIKGDEKEIRSIAELIVWKVEQDSAVQGKWHQKIEIKDTDIMEEGDQGKTIVLPDMATTLKEGIILQTEIIKAVGFVLDIVVKLTVECAGIKLEAAKTRVTAQDIQDYLDYQTQEKTVKVPIQISPKRPLDFPELPEDASQEDKDLLQKAKDLDQEEMEDLVKFLEPSESTISIDEWNGHESLQDQVTTLLEAASSILAQYKNRF